MRAHLVRHVTAISGSEVQLLACLQITLPAQPVKAKSLFSIPFFGPCLAVIQNMLSVRGPVQLLPVTQVTEYVARYLVRHTEAHRRALSVATDVEWSPLRLFAAEGFWEIRHTCFSILQ